MFEWGVVGLVPREPGQDGLEDQLSDILSICWPEGAAEVALDAHPIAGVQDREGARVAGKVALDQRPGAIAFRGVLQRGAVCRGGRKASRGPSGSRSRGEGFDLHACNSSHNRCLTVKVSLTI